MDDAVVMQFHEGVYAVVVQGPFFVGSVDLDLPVLPKQSEYDHTVHIQDIVQPVVLVFLKRLGDSAGHI